MMLERVTEQYVSAATSTSSVDREHVLHRDYESRSCTILRIAERAPDWQTQVAGRSHAAGRNCKHQTKPDQRDSYTSVRLATRRFHPAN
jgi:hypothetical protein